MPAPWVRSAMLGAGGAAVIKVFVDALSLWRVYTPNGMSSTESNFSNAIGRVKKFGELRKNRPGSSIATRLADCR